MALAVLIPKHLISQESPAEVTLRNDCRLARQVLVHGQPANKYDWALRVIEDCGADGADAIAHELRDLRKLHERTPSLDRLSESGRRLIDVAVFRAAMDIASDETAGEAARILAISLITAQVAQVDLSYEALTTDPMNGGEVLVGHTTSQGPTVLRALPSGARQEASTLLHRLAVEDANPMVRLAADQARYSVDDPQCL
ncbi:MAG TPA: hypothetical protein VK358_16840 [Longimicrobium sp.]|nr:hypothetical protein [Longimicrobium sp.]